MLVVKGNADPETCAKRSNEDGTFVQKLSFTDIILFSSSCSTTRWCTRDTTRRDTRRAIIRRPSTSMSSITPTRAQLPTRHLCQTTPFLEVSHIHHKTYYCRHLWAFSRLPSAWDLCDCCKSLRSPGMRIVDAPMFKRFISSHLGGDICAYLDDEAQHSRGFCGKQISERFSR
jgi:hypothetical protein